MICCEAGLAKAKALLVLSRREVSSSVLKRRELGVVTFRGGIFRGREMNRVLREERSGTRDMTGIDELLELSALNMYDVAKVRRR